MFRYLVLKLDLWNREEIKKKNLGGTKVFSMQKAKAEQQRVGLSRMST